MKALEVKKDINWVGALDFDIRVFDIVMYTEHGTTYNSYVLKSNEKTVLFEISKITFWDEFYARLTSCCNPADIDYIVVNHTEPDHSGALVKLLELCPKAEVVGTATAIKFLKEIVNCDFKHIAVKDGDEISLGDKTMQFFVVPLLHWPDTMYTYVKEDKTIFTCDSFGCHYCNENVFNDKIKDDFTDAYKYYFDCIMGPFKPSVLNALDKIKHLEIETICCGHGPVIRENVSKYLDMYREWATPVKNERPKVVVAFVSAYGYTKQMAELISAGISTEVNADISLFDMVEAKKADVLAEMDSADCILLGSPTLIGDALPPILELLVHLNPIIHRNKFAGAFGSYGWSGEAVGNISARLKQLKMKTPIEPLKIAFRPSDEQKQECLEFGKNFGRLLNGGANL